MLRSKMIKLIARTYIMDCDYYNYNPKQNAEIILNIIEQAGMVPPPVDKDNVWSVNKWEPEKRNNYGI